MTSRVAPRSRRTSAASASEGCGPVANAMVAVQSGVLHEVLGDRRRSRIGLGARGTHCRDENANIGVELRHPGVSEALTQDVNEPVVLTEDVGLAGSGTRFADHRGDVDAGVIRIREKQRHHDCIAGRCCEHISEIGGVLLTERHPHIDIASHHSDGVRHLVCRCRRPRIGAAVRRQDECRVGLAGS